MVRLRFSCSDKKYRVYKGHNRHEDLLRIMESLIIRKYQDHTEEEIKQEAYEWNQNQCIPPLPEKDLENQWSDAKEFVARSLSQMSVNFKIKNDNTTNASAVSINRIIYNANTTNPNLDELHILDDKLKIINNKDYVEYLLSIIKKTVKNEDALLRQILYTILSAYSNDPINLGIMAPTSEGKTYAIIQTAQYFPQTDVWTIGQMSTKMLVRQKGIAVDENNNSLETRIAELKEELANIKDKEKIGLLKEELKYIYDNSKILIDLRGKTLIFLEPPQKELWELIKPILSHDKLEIEFPYVDRTERDGLKPKRVVIRGWPACIFCSAKDESGWSTWPEIQSRFLITSPNMNKQKYQDSNLLIAQRKGLPSLIQEQIIISEQEKEMARQCALYLKLKVKNIFLGEIGKNPVWIPYYDYLASALPSNKGSDVRAANRLFSFLQIIPICKSYSRCYLTIGDDKNIIASLEDLGEALSLTQNILGIPAQKMRFFNEVFLPLVREKEDAGEFIDGQIALSINEIQSRLKKVFGKSITPDGIKKSYLYELQNNNLLYEIESPSDRRRKLYVPLVNYNDEKLTNYTNSDDSCNFLQHTKLQLPSNYIKIVDDWLKFEIFGLWKYTNSKEKIVLSNEHGQEICICQFLEKYRKTHDLFEYFSMAKSSNSYNVIFRNIEFIGFLDKNIEENYTNGQNSSNSCIYSLDPESTDISGSTINKGIEENINIHDTEVVTKDFEPSRIQQQDINTDIFASPHQLAAREPLVNSSKEDYN